MRFVAPILLIIIAVGLFFTYIDPTYDTINELKAEEKTFSDALDRSKELIAVRDRLLNTYNSFSVDDRDRLKKLLPDHVDSVRLIIDVDNIAAINGLRVENILVDDVKNINDGELLGVAGLGFDIDASYEDLKRFLSDLEDSLRILDVTSIKFTAPTDFSNKSKYSIRLKTYWLK